MVRRIKLPSPGVLIGVVALVFAMSGAAYAGKTVMRVANDSVGPKKLKAEAVGTNKLKDEAVTGAKADESTFGTVPSAENANLLGGKSAADFVPRVELQTFRAALDLGEIRTLVGVGPISVEAACQQDIVGTQDRAILYGATNQEGSFMAGDTSRRGPGGGGTFLDPSTPQASRVLGSFTESDGGQDMPGAAQAIDTGFVAGPNGEYIGFGEGPMYALNVGPKKCLFVGAVTVLPAP